MSKHEPITEQIDTPDTVNAIIAQDPATVSVFNTFGIDACCGGDVSLEEAARRDGADLAALLEALRNLTSGREAPR